MRLVDSKIPILGKRSRLAFVEGIIIDQRSQRCDRLRVNNSRFVLLPLVN